MSRVAILQSNYIPWKGYFDLINSVDHFVVYDTAQYTKNDWRNRNMIKTKDGLKWLTLPVRKGGVETAIKDIKVADQLWRKKHWASIKQSYSRSAFFDVLAAPFEKFYLNNDYEYLSQINLALIKIILGIETKIHRAEDFPLVNGKSERLLRICRELGASSYLSGPAAKDYLDVDVFQRHDISVEWMQYGGYPEYRQLFPPFAHGVTILDLLFNEGPESPSYMMSFR